jgi:hypothetical protein
MHDRLIFTMTWFHLLVCFLPLSIILLYLWPRLWHHLLSIFFGVIAGMIDVNSQEVQLTVLLLLVFGVFMGFNQPLKAWRWGLLLGVFVPLFAISSILGSSAADKMVTEGVFAAIAIVPAMIGVYVGVLLRSQARSEAIKKG